MGPGLAWTGLGMAHMERAGRAKVSTPLCCASPVGPELLCPQTQPTVGSLRALDACTAYGPQVPRRQSSETQQMDGVFLDQDLGGD